MHSNMGDGMSTLERKSRRRPSMKRMSSLVNMLSPANNRVGKALEVRSVVSDVILMCQAEPAIVIINESLSWWHCDNELLTRGPSQEQRYHNDLITFIIIIVVAIVVFRYLIVAEIFSPTFDSPLFPWQFTLIHLINVFNSIPTYWVW